MKVVIKVGTQSILSQDGTPFEPVIRHLVDQIAAFQKEGHHIILVSSGAVGSGRKVASQFLGKQYGSSIGEKQLLASLGQHELMHLYSRLFKTHNLLASQLLLTKQDFHTSFDVSGDENKGSLIIHNAKTRRVSVCNALDTLVIHADALPKLKKLVELLATKSVDLYADDLAYAALNAFYPAQHLHKAKDSDFGCEFLDYKMSIKTVSSINDAVRHITEYTSGHSEAIIAEDETAISYFLSRIDAAAVYVNASTAFTDGGQFGMSAEIGISTQKLHARGPMGLEALTSYKWIVWGDGQIRSY